MSALTDKQRVALAAVNALEVCTLTEAAAHAGITGERARDAFGKTLWQLRRRGLVGHNGKVGAAAKYLRATGTEKNRLKRLSSAPTGLDGSVENRVRLALKYARHPLKVDAIASRVGCRDGQRSRVLVALAGLERAGLAVQDERGLWTRTDELLVENREDVAA